MAVALASWHYRSMALIDDAQAADFLDRHADWSRDGGAITRTFEFADFVEAMGFVTRVALVAEKAFHHPDIDIRWNKVTLRLSTHSEGGLTEKDLELAERVDGLA
jgi:4a-hydroxytetrahydrobiopterin dehydratase